MTTDNEPGHDLPGPYAHTQGTAPKSRLTETPPPRAARYDLFWLLVLAAVAATAAGIYLALEA